MLYYYGERKRKSYFEGWYLKCQTKGGNCVALIPAIHIDSIGNKTASIQVITEESSCCIQYPPEKFSAETEKFHVQIGDNVFSEQGIWICIQNEEIDLKGEILFGAFQQLKYPIMGPFQFISNMECAHGIISMRHTLTGALWLNGKQVGFDGGIGYIECDRGRSFPSSYLWVQDVWDDGSFMLSIAQIPLGKLNFLGCICEIFLNEKSYRIATYLGAKVQKWSSCHAEVRQGRYKLEVEVLNHTVHPLKAPSTGKMVRTVHESICAGMRIRLTKGDKILLERLTDCAGFESAGC